MKDEKGKSREADSARQGLSKSRAMYTGGMNIDNEKEKYEQKWQKRRGAQ